MHNSFLCSGSPTPLGRYVSEACWSLSTLLLTRYFLTNGSDTRIYQQLNAGERRMYKIAIVVDRSASMMGTMRLQANAVCATVMALARMGLDAVTCVLTFGEDVATEAHVQSHWP